MVVIIHVQVFRSFYLQKRCTVGSLSPLSGRVFAPTFSTQNGTRERNRTLFLFLFYESPIASFIRNVVWCKSNCMSVCSNRSKRAMSQGQRHTSEVRASLGQFLTGTRRLRLTLDFFLPSFQGLKPFMIGICFVRLSGEKMDECRMMRQIDRNLLRIQPPLWDRHILGGKQKIADALAFVSTDNP